MELELSVGSSSGCPPSRSTVKIQAQIAKYVKEFDGAVVLKYGYAQGFRNRTPLNVQLLDWGELEPVSDQVSRHPSKRAELS